ncbi:uncharacterized protein G2W53_011408 [Senna tora]|uniref:Uncharacterized protein n=1 Tax=Senna tora TaxID=362788 RepID=A0A835CB37_9FABA|nr:uncharacterized protein G2W53_011408 [Senna tora]
MRSLIITTPPTPTHLSAPPSFTHCLLPLPHSSHKAFNLLLPHPNFRLSLLFNTQHASSLSVVRCSSRSGSSAPGSEGVEEASVEVTVEDGNLHGSVGSPRIPSFVRPVANLSLSDQAFFLLAFIACTTSVAFTSLVFAAVPTLFIAYQHMFYYIVAINVAMRNAATSLSKLADTAREELPSTMAAIRLSGMEISDLTLELSDLRKIEDFDVLKFLENFEFGQVEIVVNSKSLRVAQILFTHLLLEPIGLMEIADGVNKSAQALQAAEAGIRQIGSMAHQQTITMIQERASLPIISLQPVVAGAARKTSRAVGRATKTFMNIISRKEGTTEEYDDDTMNMQDFS